MAVRNDFTMDWDASPRVITVDAPSTEVIIQDLHDTCRFLESERSAMDNPPLIDTAGLESLGGGTQVGLTSTLQNALLAFEARSGPTYTQCSVSGGNVVALDGSDVPFATPIHPTAFTQVVVTASSSATTQSQAQLEHSTFNGEITVNIGGPLAQSGTTYPTGTLGRPSNNMDDALLIAQIRGIDRFKLKSNVTVTQDLSVGYEFLGSARYLLLTCDNTANMLGCSVLNLNVTGELDGLNALENCDILTVTGVSGTVNNCAIATSLGVSGNILITSSYSNAEGDLYPVIIGSAGAIVQVRAFHGSLGLDGFVDGSHSIGIEDEGRAIVESSCTGGIIHLRGAPFDIVDNSGVGCDVRDETESKKTREMHERLDLNAAKPNTYQNDATSITNGDWTLDKTDNLDGTSTVQRA